jgi:uncharacterized membrane protein YkvA (DUF1232 family)
MHSARLNHHLQTFERARLSWRLLRDPRVPTWTKALLPLVAALYVLLPIDLIPDFILGLGQIDDLSVLGITVFAMTKLLPRFAPSDVVDEHLTEMRGGRRAKKHTRGDVIDADFTVIEPPTEIHRARAKATDREN